MPRPRRARARARAVPAVLALVTALIAALLVTGTTTAPAAAGGVGKITGQVRAPGSPQGIGKLQVSLFDRNWNFIRKRSADRSGVFTFGSMSPGVYWVQVSDRRPVYARKYATTDVRVRVRAGRTAVPIIRARPGAKITGTVRAGGRVAPRARLVAVSGSGSTTEVLADGQGRFALAGLAAGNYSVFAYDRAKRYTGGSLWVPGLEAGGARHTAIDLRTRAGVLVVDLYAGRKPLRQRVWVTAVNRRTGQYWVARSRRGQVTLAGLHPGRYRLSVPGAGNHLSRTGNIGRIGAGGFRITSFRLNKRGGWFTGSAVDGTDSTGLKGVTVSVYDSAGSLRARTRTRKGGTFRVGGSFGNEKQLTVVLEVPSGVAGRKYKKVVLTGKRSVAGRGIALGSIAMARNGKF